MKSLLIISSFCAFLPAFAQNVALDPAFGNQGIAVTPNTTEINRIVVAPDGSIFSAGYAIEPGPSGIYHLTVTKHLSNGSIDTGFGINGIATTVIDYSEFPLDIQLQSDGKVLVSGSSYLGPTQSGPGDYRAFIVRYTASGAPDNTFGTNGIFKLPFTDSHTASIIPLADGSIVMAGNGNGYGTLTKINAAGAPDNQFGMNGTLFLADLNFAFILWNSILLSDNTILCVGYDITDFENTKVAFCKLDPDGNYVSAFGQNGKVVMDLHSSPGGMPEMTEFFSHAAETADHKIILAGTAGSTIFMKIHADGTPDAAFGTNGMVTNSLPFSDFALQDDGKILVAGSTPIGTYNYGYSVSRLDQQGNTDPSFNGSGTFNLDISAENDHVQSIELIGTKLIAGGSSKTNSTDNFTLARIDFSQNLQVNEPDSEDFSIYPNPFSDELTLSVPAGEISEITLIDASGRIVTGNQPLKGTSLKLGYLSNGAYQLLITKSNGETIRKKVIKHG